MLMNSNRQHNPELPGSCRGKGSQTATATSSCSQVAAGGSSFCGRMQSSEWVSLCLSQLFCLHATQPGTEDRIQQQKLPPVPSLLRPWAAQFHPPFLRGKRAVLATVKFTTHWLCGERLWARVNGVGSVQAVRTYHPHWMCLTARLQHQRGWYSHTACTGGLRTEF